MISSAKAFNGCPPRHVSREALRSDESHNTRSYGVVRCRTCQFSGRSLADAFCQVHRHLSIERRRLCLPRYPRRPSRPATARSISAIAVRRAMTPVPSSSGANINILLRRNSLRPMDEDRLALRSDLRGAFGLHCSYQVQPSFQPFPKFSGANILGSPTGSPNRISQTTARALRPTRTARKFQFWVGCDPHGELGLGPAEPRTDEHHRPRRRNDMNWFDTRALLQAKVTFYLRDALARRLQ